MEPDIYSSDITKRQMRFCEEYIIDLNQSGAYRRAGYKPKSDNAAWVCASKLLRNAKVKKYISQLQQPIIKKSQNLAERVIEELENLAFSDIGNLINPTGKFISIKDIIELPPNIRRTIESFEETKLGLKIKFVKKLPALELLCKHMGLLTNKIELTGNSQDSLKNLTIEELEEKAKRLKKLFSHVLEEN